MNCEILSVSTARSTQHYSRWVLSTLFAAELGDDVATQYQTKIPHLIPSIVEFEWNLNEISITMEWDGMKFGMQQTVPNSNSRDLIWNLDLFFVGTMLKCTGM